MEARIVFRQSNKTGNTFALLHSAVASITAATAITKGTTCIIGTSFVTNLKLLVMAEVCRITAQSRTTSTRELPFRRIAFYRKVRIDPVSDPHTSVHTIVRHKPHVCEPTFFDTMFYTMPLREEHVRDSNNCIVAFRCHQHATHFSDIIASGTPEHPWLQNHGESTAATARVQSFRLSDLAFYAWNMGMDLAVVHNSYCEGQQREPIIDVQIWKGFDT